MNPTLRWLWFGQLISNLGTQCSLYGIGLWSFEQRGQLLRFAAVAFVVQLAKVLVLPLLGRQLGHWPPRRLMLIANGIGVTAFFCFMFSWVELLLARTLTSVNAKPIAATMTRTVSAAGMDWGVLAAAGVLTLIPGALVIWFVRNYIAKGFALGRV